MKFGKIIQELRESKNITRTALANNIGVHQTLIGRWEKNEVEPSAGYIIALAEYFDVTTDFLLGLDNSGRNFIPEETIKLKGVARGGEAINIEIKKSALPELQRLLDAAAEQTRKDLDKK